MTSVFGSFIHGIQKLVKTLSIKRSFRYGYLLSGWHLLQPARKNDKKACSTFFYIIVNHFIMCSQISLIPWQVLYYHVQTYYLKGLSILNLFYKYIQPQGISKHLHSYLLWLYEHVFNKETDNENQTEMYTVPTHSDFSAEERTVFSSDEDREPFFLLSLLWLLLLCDLDLERCLLLWRERLLDFRDLLLDLLLERLK